MMLMTIHMVTMLVTIASDGEGASRVLQTCCVVERRRMPCLFSHQEEEGGVQGGVGVRRKVIDEIINS